MKCSKCGYDYPAKETKCPYCGEPNKLGMEWEKEEDETRKETLLTKAKCYIPCHFMLPIKL